MNTTNNLNAENTGISTEAHQTANVVKHTKDDAAAAIKSLRHFIGNNQMVAMLECCAGDEKQFFIDKLVEVYEIVTSMPKTYETDGQGDKAVIHLHYFTPSADFYITERDCETEQLQAFGLADIFGDGGELGYISIVELLKCGAELDLHWTAKTMAQLRIERAA